MLTQRQEQAQAAAVDALYAHNLTALMWAAGQGQAETVKLLLGRGARTDLTDDRGFTATRVAQDGGHASVVALLAPR